MRTLVSGAAALALIPAVITFPASVDESVPEDETEPTANTAALPAADTASGPGELTNLGTPLQDVLLIGGTVAPGPDGTPALWSVSSGDPAHLNAVDPATGEAVARHQLPGSGGSWAVDHGPDGEIYVGTYSAGGVYRWTADGGVEPLGNPIDGETFVYDVSVADDGHVFGGTYPGGRIFGLDPATDEFRDYGALSPDHNYARSVAVHQDTIFAGTEHPALVFSIDRETGESTELPPPPDMDLSQAAAYDVDVVGDHLFVRFGDAFPSPLFVWDIEAEQWVDRIDDAHGLEPSPPDEEGRTYLIVDGELVRYDPADGSLNATGVPFTGRVANTRGIGWAELDLPDYPGRSVVGMLWRGMMYRYNPTTGAHDFVSTNVEGEPIDITALSEGPDQRMYAGGFLNGGFAAINPDSGDVEEFHTFSQSEAMTSHDGRLYVGAYPDARIYGYDPELPWHSPEYSPSPDPGLDDNPERLFDFADELQIRPRAMTSAGDYLAVGTMPKLGELGGVFALYDPSSGELVHSERHLIDDESIVDLTYRDGVVYGSTSIYGGQTATPPTQPEATVFAWSVAEQELLWESAPIAEAPRISSLAFDNDGALWGIAGHEVFSLDTSTGEVVEQTALGSSGSTAGHLAFNAVDGHLYATPGHQQFVRVNPETVEHEVVHDGGVSHVTTHSNGDVYVSSGHELLRFTPRCTTTITGERRGSVSVEDGTLCLSDAQVSGSVSVTDGAGLVVEGDSVVSGAVAVNGASPVSIVGATIRGSLSVTDGPAPAAVISDSTIVGSLACAGNAEPPTDNGVPNEIRGTPSGQCADLGNR